VAQIRDRVNSIAELDFAFLRDASALFSRPIPEAGIAVLNAVEKQSAGLKFVRKNTTVRATRVKNIGARKAGVIGCGSMNANSMLIERLIWRARVIP
jgi:hypothetical protein